MVAIEIRDEIWELYKKSWAVMDVKKHDQLVRMLEHYIRDSSLEVLNDAKKDLL